MHNLDPNGTVDVNGVKVPVILCHQDSCNLKMGSNHSDVYHWFKKHGKTMDDVRKDVSALMGKTYTQTSPSPSPSSPTSSSVSTGRVDTVKEVQNWANTNYKSGLVVDGIYGKNTKKALIRILQTELNQTYNAKLSVDGVWGEKTKAACPSLKVGIKNDVVGVLQALLICNGFTNAYLDKDYGSSTASAVESYQKKYGLVADKIAGKNTFAKLCG